MHRKSKIEKKIFELWKVLGTLEFKTFEDLSMMLDESDFWKVMTTVDKLNKENRIYLEFDNYWILDYIPF